MLLLLCAAHCKSSMLGAGLTIPITQGRLNLGTWQVCQLGSQVAWDLLELVTWLFVAAKLVGGLQACRHAVALLLGHACADWECQEVTLISRPRFFPLYFQCLWHTERLRCPLRRAYGCVSTETMAATGGQVKQQLYQV
jgi:hypothetical protein